MCKVGWRKTYKRRNKGPTFLWHHRAPHWIRNEKLIRRDGIWSLVRMAPSMWKTKNCRMGFIFKQNICCLDFQTSYMLLVLVCIVQVHVQQRDNWCPSIILCDSNGRKCNGKCHGLHLVACIIYLRQAFILFNQCLELDRIVWCVLVHTDTDKWFYHRRVKCLSSTSTAWEHARGMVISPKAGRFYS